VVKTYALAVAMLPRMLEDDRRRAGWSAGQAAWRLGITVREYRELEAGARDPSFETWDRICKLYRVAADIRDGSVATVVQGRVRVLPSDWWSLLAGLRTSWFSGCSAA
jgi:DNA-binding XRE family transcriptional regulator